MIENEKKIKYPRMNIEFVIKYNSIKLNSLF